MNIKLGEKVRELRKRKDVTQEKFAEYLGVTPQAVSRWESAICYPDVGLLPAIANFFSISLDELFEAEKALQRLKKLKWDIYEKRAHGYIDESIQMTRELLKEFPNDYELMKELMYGLSYTLEYEIKNRDEIIFLGNRILEDCTDDSIRYGVIQTLACTYGYNDETEKAKEMVKKLPSVYCTETVMMPVVTKGEEKVSSLREEIFAVSDILSGAVRAFGKHDFDKINEMDSETLRENHCIQQSKSNI